MSSKVLVYRRPGCMFCRQVEDLLRESDIDFESVEIEDRNEQEALSRKHGALSFPLVLIDGRYVGGFTHVVQLHSEGRLLELVGRTKSGAKPASSGAGGASKPLLGSLEGWAALGQMMKDRGKPPDERG